MAKPIMFDKITENGQTVLVPKPQHMDGNNNPVETGEDNPLPTADNKLLEKLDKMDERLEKIESGDTVINNQLTGSIVAEKVEEDFEIEKKDRNSYNMKMLDIFDYPPKFWGFFITLDEGTDEPPELEIRSGEGRRSSSSYDSDDVVIFKNKTTTSNQVPMYKEIKDEHPFGVEIKLWNINEDEKIKVSELGFWAYL